MSDLIKEAGALFEEYEEAQKDCPTAPYFEDRYLLDIIRQLLPDARRMEWLKRCHSFEMTMLYDDAGEEVVGHSIEAFIPERDSLLYGEGKTPAAAIDAAMEKEAGDETK